MADYLPDQFAEIPTTGTGDTASVIIDGATKKENRFVGAIVKAQTAGTFSVTCGSVIFVEDMPVIAGQQVAVGPFRGIGCGAGDASDPSIGRLSIVGASLGAGGRVSVVHFTNPAE